MAQVESPSHPSEVGKMRTQLVGGHRVVCIRMVQTAQRCCSTMEQYIRGNNNYCCFLYPSPIPFKGSYDWAQTTLKLHASDKRSHLYTLKQLEEGKTHDPLWNAAQVNDTLKEVVEGGRTCLWPLWPHWSPRWVGLVRLARWASLSSVWVPHEAAHSEGEDEHSGRWSVASFGQGSVTAVLPYWNKTSQRGGPKTHSSWSEFPGTG